MRQALSGLLLVALPVVYGCSEHASDDQLLGNFEEHEKDFSRLVSMILVDKNLVVVADDWTNPEDPRTVGVSNKRIQEYRTIFRRIGIPRGFTSFSTNPARIIFFAPRRGIVGSGSHKGYAYLEEKPDMVVTDLDEYWAKMAGSFEAYRHIRGNWYLYCEVD